jgi:hypothetical protein
MKKLFLLLAFTGILGAASATTILTANKGTAVVSIGEEKKGDEKKKEKGKEKACCKKDAKCADQKDKACCKKKAEDSKAASESTSKK